MRYRSRISGPLLDRIDLYVDVPSVEVGELRASVDEETSAAVRARVIVARRGRTAQPSPFPQFVAARPGGVDVQTHALEPQHYDRAALAARVPLGYGSRVLEEQPTSDACFDDAPASAAWCVPQRESVRRRGTRLGYWCSRLGTAGLGLLVSAASTLAADVFPKRMCDALPEVNANVKTWVAQVAPELAKVPVRVLSETAALQVFDRAAVAGWGGIDLFTDGVFRESCVFYLPSRTLRAVDAMFDVELLTVISGKDKDGRVFQMDGILAGLGKLLVFYDRDGIVYRNQKQNRDFMLSSRVEFHSSGRGRLEHVNGLCAKVFALGCVGIRSLIKEGDKVIVSAGLFKLASPLNPIRVREAAAGKN